MSAVPSQMPAWVVREERHGDPESAMLLENVTVPEARVGEVIVRVKAAGINHNHLWACKGHPVKISQLHPEDPTHIGGSDASGIVAAVGAGVHNWKVGDEVITHPGQTCGQCTACNGFEPLACRKQKAWGFETSYGSFGVYARVQAQQLLPKPKHLSWAEASSYGLKLFTAYRMLFVQAKIRPGDRVLVWGASGGMGSYAIQLCRAVNAIPICVVSSEDKADFCRTLGAELFIDRRNHPYLSEAGDGEIDSAGQRAFAREIRSLTGGHMPDIVFEHTGAETFATSVFVARKNGKIVICGATSGYKLTFDARYLWMHQKQILGSHGCNAHDAMRANLLVEQKVIKPTLTEIFSFSDAAKAHQDLLRKGTCLGSLAIDVKE